MHVWRSSVASLLHLPLASSGVPARSSRIAAFDPHTQGLRTRTLRSLPIQHVPLLM